MDFSDKDHGKGVFKYEDLTQQAGPQIFLNRKNQSVPQLCHCLQTPRISWDGGNMGQPNFEPHIPTEQHRSMIEFPMMYVNKAFQQLLMNFFSE